MSKHAGLFEDITEALEKAAEASATDMDRIVFISRLERWQAFLDDLPDDLPMQVKLMALGDLNSGANVIQFAKLVQEAR